MDTIMVGTGGRQRRIAVEVRRGAGAPIVWLGGFRSDMAATKALALDRWAQVNARPLVRFDYSGHGASGGHFTDGTIGAWLEETLAVLERFTEGRPVLVGSSMGGWLAVLAAIALCRDSPARAPAGLVLIAPAIDFTEALMWDILPPAARQAIETDGVYLRPTPYDDAPYPITRALIEEGRRHLLLGSSISPGCRVHILQGMMDPDVPWRHALRLVERLPDADVQLTLIKDGEHRLSRPQDIDLIIRAVEGLDDHSVDRETSPTDRAMPR